MERIYVTVRARPLSLEEAKTSPWRISGNSIFLSNQSTKFDFDRIFGEECKTVEVYEVRTKEIVAAAVHGFNGTVFAYGQTNSGKTHTMRGSAIEPGVIPLAVHDLFQIIQEDMGREFLLRMSYMEIYNEEINDLLAPEHRKLQIHESLERGIFVAGLKEEIVASPEQVLDLMEFGESHRHIGETNMNVYSSRSHTIFRMIIESRDKSEDGDTSSSCDAVRVSVLNLVDLAGSERAAKTGAEGARLKEGSHINKSLMTLGTVIKKLSEGAESQGGHVPFRDSKLTRILQPALGGNANTAIICNITLAQVHADETKSSLQFASRALRITNCARINEILTDAALLKRQKKEIAELREKLQGSHSEHFEEEILNLRNTLLQSELERERISLELKEEKEAQALRERRLQEQAKKIENLSSMVLYSNRSEKHDHNKKDKRRDTWCPGNISQKILREAASTALPDGSAKKSTRPERDMGLPLPFEELVNENQVGKEEFAHIPDKNRRNDSVEDCTLPDAHALLHVTSRRKLPVMKKSSLENSELAEIQMEYEDLLLKYESQRTIKEVEIDCLTKKLAEAGYYSDVKNSCSSCQLSGNAFRGDKILSRRESEAIQVIKQLEEQIMLLEVEKSSIQQNLDSVVDLATNQNISARANYEELYHELLNARQEARLGFKNLAFEASVLTKKEENTEFFADLLKDVQGMVLEVQNLRSLVELISSVVDEQHQSLSAASHEFLEFNSSLRENLMHQNSIASKHEKIHNWMRERIVQLESEKSLLCNRSVDLDKQIQELQIELENSEKTMKELAEHHNLEKSELLFEIQSLEKEISRLSSCSMAKEKEILKKDLEKTKVKLKETEFKLRNAFQEKTKLEGEKAYAEREIKRLHSQKNLLERDICKRDSLANSVAERRRESKAFDAKKAQIHGGSNEQIFQGDYKQLEVLAFEMETTIASLEENLAVSNAEKDEALARSEVLASDLEATSTNLYISNSELKVLQDEISCMRSRLEESQSLQQKMESSVNLLLGEKEELAMQLTDALLELEEEKAIWSAKEKASIEAISEKSKLSNAEMMLLKREISQVRHELESCREDCKVLDERLMLSEENAEREYKCSMEKSLEINQLRDNLKIFEVENRKCQDERDSLFAQIEEQQMHMNEMEFLNKNYNDVLSKARGDAEELEKKVYNMESKLCNDKMNNSKENAKLRMRLRAMQAKLDAFRGRYNEAMDEICLMNKKYGEASAKLKEQLASYGLEVLHLKKLLAEAKSQ